MSGRSIEFFPRGVLVAGAGADATYFSDPVEAEEAGSLAWWFEALASFPATVTNPATAHVETSNVLGFQGWRDLTPGGLNPSFGTPSTGVVTGLMRFLRVRVVVLQGEAALLEFRAVAREG